MMNNKLIGISGFARCGKDTFYECCSLILSSRGKESEGYSFAYALKDELNDLLIKYTGVSAFTEDNNEKDLIRPLLVTYGTQIRRKINHNCWIEKIEAKVERELSAGKYVFIRDVRFLNEAEWIKSKGGLLINMSREGVGPANTDESEQYELFKHLIDYKISWPTFGEDFSKNCTNHVLESGLFEKSFVEKNFQTETLK